MLQIRHRRQQSLNFRLAWHVGKPPWLSPGRNVLFDDPVPLERDGVKKAKRSHSDGDRAGRLLLVPRQIDLIGADLLSPQAFGRLTKMAGKQRSLLDVTGLRQRREIADLHVLDHAQAQWGHDQLLDEMNSATGRQRIVARLSSQTRDNRQEIEVA